MRLASCLRPASATGISPYLIAQPLGAPLIRPGSPYRIQAKTKRAFKSSGTTFLQSASSKLRSQKREDLHQQHTMESSQDFKALRDSVQSALVTVTRSVNALANEDLSFQRTVHPSVATQLDQNTERLLQLASGVLKSAGKLTSQRATPLDDVDDVEIQWKGVVDVIDSLLEKSDTCLDEYTGLIKRKDAPTAESVCIDIYWEHSRVFG